MCQCVCVCVRASVCVCVCVYGVCVYGVYGVYCVPGGSTHINPSTYLSSCYHCFTPTLAVCFSSLPLACFADDGGRDPSEDRLKEEWDPFTGTTMVETSTLGRWARNPGKLLVPGLSRDSKSVDCMLRDAPAQMEPVDGKGRRSTTASCFASSPHGTSVHFPVYLVVNGSAILYVLLH